MAVTSLSLPVDVPWERWCVSEDMIDQTVCDSDRPAKWQSSIAVFRYVPDDDFQSYPGRRITYLKVVCTVAGYQPKADEIQGVSQNLGGIGITPFTQAELERRLASYSPCNEAIVQVTVGPKHRRKGEKPVPLDRYPYFMEFQPKKRELIEVATDTNEVMSRSLESLDIKKSAGTAQSQEVLDVDQGFSVGAQGSYAGTGGGFNYSQQGQSGTKQLGNAESGLVRTTDASHERRETLSHTTQLSQLRHLLDAYHLGTNRAVFFIQPRPHTLQEPSGFVRGPRPIEGVQEFFLVVNQPADEEDFCVDVRLDTGHLSEYKVMTYGFKTDSVVLPFSNPTPVNEDTDLMPDGTTTGPTYRDALDVTIPFGGGTATLWSYSATLPYNCRFRARSASVSYQPAEADYVIDVAALGGQPGNTNGYRVLPTTAVTGEASYAIENTPDNEVLTITATGTSRACFKAAATDLRITTFISPAIFALAFLDPTGLSAALATGGEPTLITFEAIKTAAFYSGAPGAINQKMATAQVELEVFLRTREPTIDTGQVKRVFFVTTRSVCCCADDRKERTEGVVYEAVLSEAEAPGQMRLEEAGQLHASMRQEMLASLASPARTAPRPLAETRVWSDLVVPALLQNPFARDALRSPAAYAVPENLQARLPETFRKGLAILTRLDVLLLPDVALAAAAGLDSAEMGALRSAMLATPLPARDWQVQASSPAPAEGATDDRPE
jgi:hypothetical protein